MVRHIVMYRLKDENKEENARQMKEKLEGLNGKIEGLHGLRIDRDCNSRQYDVCLTADFDDLAAVLLISAVWWGSGRIIPAMRRLSVSQEVRLPVLMYHGVHSNPKKAGDYVITPQALEEDLLYLQRQGCTTVVMSDLIAYVQQGTPLPEKPVMITFDDGYYNNYLNAYPLLQKYQMKAVISIIVGETDKYSELDENKENYSHITGNMINEMMESALIEIQTHTYNRQKPGNPRRSASPSCE